MRTLALDLYRRPIRAWVPMILALLLGISGLAAATSSHAADAPATPVAHDASSPDLLGMSLEDAMNVKVTTASKKESPWFGTAAAVYVISSEDMVRSGVHNVAEALRLVPGMEVARIDGAKWAVTARGFNGRFANKLLVLVDGYSVYAPVFGGVYWDALQVSPSDIDRIEVIRGPGATLWGANAVNGVINIITRDSGDSRHSSLEMGTGSTDHAFGGARIGGTLGETATYRVFGRGANIEGYPSLLDPTQDDNGRSGGGGFRVDWNPSARDHMLLTGEGHRDHERQLLTSPSLAPPYSTTLWDEARVDGANFSTRWTRTSSQASEISTRLTFDELDRYEWLGVMKAGTMDADFQHRFTPRDGQETVWGLSYRLSRLDFHGTGPLFIPDPTRTDYRAGGFVQHSMSTHDHRAMVSFGTKLEQSTTSKFSVQPSVNASFQPTPRQTVWGSVSYALRTYLVGEVDADVQALAFPDPYGSGLTLVPTMVPNPDGKDERLVAYEAGYRVRPVERVTIDVAAYWNEYDRLRSLTPGTPSLAFAGSVPYLFMPLQQGGAGTATGKGVETMVWVQPANRWQLRGVYTFSLLDQQDGNASASPLKIANASQPPHHSGYLQSLVDLGRNLEFDTWLRVVDRLPETSVPAYGELDARLGWRPHPAFELSVEGKNLLHERHMEFIKDFVYEPSWAERGVLVMLRVRG